MLIHIHIYNAHVITFMLNGTLASALNLLTQKGHGYMFTMYAVYCWRHAEKMSTEKT